jgi:hypothetical protein
VSFVHDDRDFPQLLTLVTEETRIAPALVEKDYWVTHCMWALHQTGLDLWFKGGTRGRSRAGARSTRRCPKRSSSLA